MVIMKEMLYKLRWWIVMILFGQTTTLALMNCYKKILNNRIERNKIKQNWIKARRIAYTRKNDYGEK